MIIANHYLLRYGYATSGNVIKWKINSMIHRQLKCLEIVKILCKEKIYIFYAVR